MRISLFEKQKNLRMRITLVVRNPSYMRGREKMDLILLCYNIITCFSSRETSHHSPNFNVERRFVFIDAFLSLPRQSFRSVPFVFHFSPEIHGDWTSRNVNPLNKMSVSYGFTSPFHTPRPTSSMFNICVIALTRLYLYVNIILRLPIPRSFGHIFWTRFFFLLLAFLRLFVGIVISPHFLFFSSLGAIQIFSTVRASKLARPGRGVASK